MENIGIWKKKAINNKILYVRDSTKNAEWRLWANTHTIDPIKTNKRFVMIGESVARGYFYDPYFTPAFLLKSILEDNVEEELEVVDLACSGMGFQKLCSTCFESLALNPDVLIIYAGNNWFKPQVVFTERNPDFTDFIKLEGSVETSYSDLIADFFKTLTQAARAQNAQVLVVIPEYNILDWCSDEKEREFLNFSNTDYARWYEAKTKLEKENIGSDLTITEDLANQLIEANPTNPYGYEVLAKVKVKQKLFAEARSFFEKAKDTAIYRPHNSTPRTLSVIKNIIIKEANINKLLIVDLPSIFKEYSDNSLPGRELFLDYCHLSLKGNQLAVAGIAQQLLTLFFNKNADLDKLQISALEPEKNVLAMAHIFAAIHNAHYGQPYRIVYYHCLLSIQLSEGDQLIKFMKHIASLVTRRLSSVLCKDYEEILFSGLGEQYGKGTGLLHPESCKHMDITLVNAITDALMKNGINVEEHVNSLRMKEHAVEYHKLDLLKSYHQLYINYQSESLKKIFYQAFNKSSSFYLVSENAVNIKVKLSLRLKNKCKEPVKILMNNELVWQEVVGIEWINYSFMIPGNFLVKGINKIEILWPNKQGYIHYNKRLYKGESLLNHYSNCLKPVFAEIHTFLIKTDNDMT